MALRQEPDTAANKLRVADSLYIARDTTALAAELRSWKGASNPRIELYRGMVALWTGSPTRAIAILRPLLDSSQELTPPQRRDAISALAESYARKRQYTRAAELYDTELESLDRTIDSAKARLAAAAARDSAGADPVIDALTSPEPEAPEPRKIPGQLAFIALLLGLFVIPKLLQRFRIPGAITSLLMGFAASVFALIPNEPTVRLFSTLGIVSLFLFAGLEVEAAELRRSLRPLIVHAVIWAALAILVMFAGWRMLDLSPRAAALLSLALVTPSTGFILSSLSSFGLAPMEQTTVRTYAIGSELLALTALFFVLQSTSLAQLVVALASMAAVVIIIPIAFHAFSSFIAPYAPRSEFAFLLLVGVACAYATRLLGVYYLVGAFLVGVAAQRFRATHPAMSSEKMVDALESFGSVFIPFYFFHAGTGILREHLSWRAAAVGVLFLITLVPLRIAVIALHRRITLHEGFIVSRRVASAMIPTLVFTLVIVEILVSRYGLAPAVAGALVIYTVVNTTFPGFVLRAQPADFEDIDALPP